MLINYVKKYPLSSSIKEDVKKLDSFSEQAIMLVNNHIETEDNFYFFLNDKVNELSNLIPKATITELITFCERIQFLDIDYKYKKYLWLLVANNTPYLESLCTAFMDNSPIKEVLLWVANKSNYVNHSNYLLNTSIKLLRENNEYEWVAMV